MTDTNQLPPSEREAFEAFAQNCPMGKYSITRRGDGYDSSHTQLMWDAWQARAQVQGAPSWWMRETDEGAEWTDTAPLVLSGWTPLYTAPQSAQATQAVPMTDVVAYAIHQVIKPSNMTDSDWHSGAMLGHENEYREKVEQAAARAILALRPQAVPMTERELELIDGMIAVQLDHAQRCDAINNRAMAEKQKGWDMERVELLRRIRSFGITAQAKKDTP